MRSSPLPNCTLYQKERHEKMSSLRPEDVSEYLKVTLEEPGKTPIMRDLQTHLPGAVLLHALAIRERGGLSKQDALWAERMGPELDKAPLFSGDKEIRNSTQFNIIARGIATLAHFPRGVSLFGMHFEANTSSSSRGSATPRESRENRAENVQSESGLS